MAIAHGTACSYGVTEASKFGPITGHELRRSAALRGVPRSLEGNRGMSPLSATRAGPSRTDLGGGAQVHPTASRAPLVCGEDGPTSSLLRLTGTEGLCCGDFKASMLGVGGSKMSILRLGVGGNSGTSGTFSSLSANMSPTKVSALSIASFCGVRGLDDGTRGDEGSPKAPRECDRDPILGEGEAARSRFFVGVRALLSALPCSALPNSALLCSAIRRRSTSLSAHSRRCCSSSTSTSRRLRSASTSKASFASRCLDSVSSFLNWVSRSSES